LLAVENRPKISGLLAQKPSSVEALAVAFKPWHQHSEKEVNEILKRYNEDTTSLRRGLAEYKLMQRDGCLRAHPVIQSMVYFNFNKPFPR